MKLVYDAGRSRASAPPRLSIAVRLKNERPFLPALIHSLRAQSAFADCELIFLDSGSTDGSVEYLRECADRIYSIEADTFQFGRSCNQILSVSNAAYVGLFSAHVVLVDSDILSKAANMLDECSNLAAVYFRQTATGEAMIDHSAYEALYLERRFPVVDLLISPAVLSGTPPVSNAAALIRRSVWQVQPFPEVRASEDLLWARTVAKSGSQLAYLGSCGIVHNHCESPEQIFRRVKINKIAQHGARPMPLKAAAYFFGIFAALVLKQRTPFSVAFRYARAHAAAYVR